MPNIIIKDGKPVFIGQEDPNNPPVTPVKGTQMQCPVCSGMFDYLLGEDTSDGGKLGCEVCWKPSETPSTSNEVYDLGKEIL